MRYVPFLLVSVMLGQDSTDFELDLDAMWENTVWEEIQDVVDVCLLYTSPSPRD